MNETVIVHNKERRKRLVTVTSHLVLDDNGGLLEGRTYKRYSPDFPCRERNIEREAGIIAMSNQLGLPAVRLIRYSSEEGVLETEYVPGENLAVRLTHPLITQDEVRLLIISALQCIFSFNNAVIFLFDTHLSNFIIRQHSNECIFCDFGLAFSPQSHPFNAPPPTRCDRGYFSSEQNRAIGIDLARFEANRDLETFESNNLDPRVDIFVLANQTLKILPHALFDNALLKILNRMHKEQYQSVADILTDLDETTPPHLRGTPEAVPIERLGDTLAQSKWPTKRWRLHGFLPATVIIVALSVTLIAALTMGGFGGKQSVSNAPATTPPKPQPVVAAEVSIAPKANLQAERHDPPKGDVPAVEGEKIIPVPAKKTPSASIKQPAKTEKATEPVNSHKQQISNAARLLRNPSLPGYRDGITILTSLVQDAEARLMLDQELERARRNIASQRVSQNQMGVQILYALKKSKSPVSEKAGAEIDAFYKKAISSVGIGNVKRLQLLAAKKHAGAQFSLGKIHEHGDGRKKNYARAYRYYSAAQAGNYEARKAVDRLERSVLPELLESGNHTTWKEGFQLLLAIAEVPKNMEAQYTVGKIYQNGALGVIRDPLLARKYLKLAARNGKEEAKIELARL